MKNKKKMFIITLLFLSFAMILGTSIAYFSDIVTGSGTLKAGTLDIDGSIEMYVNGSTTAVTSVENFNPGDIVVVKTNVTNGGNKSAHIRTMLEKKSSNFTDGIIKIANGEKTKSDMESLTSLLTMPYSSVSKIINGTGANAEIEINGLTKYEEVFTIYFDKTATNSEQGKSIVLDFKIQAMQYRNNTNPVWDDVVTTPFSL